MDINPYQPPADPKPTQLEDQKALSQLAPRPLGVSILAVVHLVVGLLLVVAAGVFIYLLEFEEAQVFGAPVWFIFGILGFVILLAVSSSVGMWRGDQWGWWLAAFYYVWGVLGVMVDIISLISRLEVGIFPPAVAAKLIQFAIHALILLYLFKGTVRAFFRLGLLRVHRALLPLAIVAIVVMAATYVALMLSDPPIEADWDETQMVQPHSLRLD